MSDSIPSNKSLFPILVILGIGFVGLLVLTCVSAGMIFIAQAREQARRAQCQSHLKQWGLASHNYATSKAHFPIGVIDPDIDRGDFSNVSQRGKRSWVIDLWPYMEQQALADQYQADQPFDAPINQFAVRARVGTYYCPSDREGMWVADENTRSRGSYAVNWGPRHFDDPLEPQATLGAFTINQGTELEAIRDGLSGTLMIAEILMAARDSDRDYRGDFLTSHPGGAQFMSINTPNSGSDQTLCVDTERPAPCINNQKAAYIAARSKHRGGINATMCDGSVRFIADSVDANLWKALSTMAGQEVAKP